MKRAGNILIGLIGTFTLGLYVSQHFKYNEPIELRRWILTSLFTLMFLAMGLTKSKDENE